MNRKKIFGLFLTAMGVLTIAATALAALNETAARETAAKWVPAGAIHLQTQNELDEYEVKFLDQAAGVHYEIEVSKITGAVTEVKTKLKGDPGSLTVKLSQADVENIVRSEFPGAAIRQVKLETDDGYQQYEVRFTAEAVRGKMEINPETGAIIERELNY